MIKKLYCMFLALILTISCSIASATQIQYDDAGNEYCMMIRRESIEW